MKKLLIISLSLLLFACNDTSKQDALKAEITQINNEFGKYLSELEDLQMDLQHNENMFDLSGEVQYIEEMQQIAAKSAKIVAKIDSLEIIATKKTKELNKLKN